MLPPVRLTLKEMRTLGRKDDALFEKLLRLFQLSERSSEHSYPASMRVRQTETPRRRHPHKQPRLCPRISGAFLCTGSRTSLLRSLSLVQLAAWSWPGCRIPASRSASPRPPGALILHPPSRTAAHLRHPLPSLAWAPWSAPRASVPADKGECTNSVTTEDHHVLSEPDSATGTTQCRTTAAAVRLRGFVRSAPAAASMLSGAECAITSSRERKASSEPSKRTVAWMRPKEAFLKASVSKGSASIAFPNKSPCPLLCAFLDWNPTTAHRKAA